jgi:hypothetical protein
MTENIGLRSPSREFARCGELRRSLMMLRQNSPVRETSLPAQVYSLTGLIGTHIAAGFFTERKAAADERAKDPSVDCR